MLTGDRNVSTQILNVRRHGDNKRLHCVHYTQLVLYPSIQVICIDLPLRLTTLIISSRIRNAV